MQLKLRSDQDDPFQAVLSNIQLRYRRPHVAVVVQGFLAAPHSMLCRRVGAVAAAMPQISAAARRTIEMSYAQHYRELVNCYLIGASGVNWMRLKVRPLARSMMAMPLPAAVS